MNANHNEKNPVPPAEGVHKPNRGGGLMIAAVMVLALVALILLNM